MIKRSIIYGTLIIPLVLVIILVWYINVRMGSILVFNTMLNYPILAIWLL